MVAVAKNACVLTLATWLLLHRYCRAWGGEKLRELQHLMVSFRTAQHVCHYREEIRSTVPPQCSKQLLKLLELSWVPVFLLVGCHWLPYKVVYRPLERIPLFYGSWGVPSRYSAITCDFFRPRKGGASSPVMSGECLLQLFRFPKEP